jgi:hypothetical protein
MTIDQNLVDEFAEYLLTLKAPEVREIIRQFGAKACDRFSGCMVVGTVRNPADLGDVIHSLIANLDPADQVVAGMALLRVVTALMGAWFAAPEMADAPGVDRVNTQFSAIAAQIARLDLMMVDPQAQPLIDPLPQGSAIAAAAAEVATMTEAQGLDAIEAIAMVHTQKFPGSLFINEPKTGEAIIEFFVQFLSTRSPNVCGFVAMNLIGILARSMEQTLRDPRNNTPDAGKSEAIAVMNQIARTMQALGERVNTMPSRESVAS